jgi:WS/DGAT/MGAT family acyltransferase
VTIPLFLARPYWIEDPGFDIEFHVRHIALPKPGDWKQLCTQVARLHARPLDRNRPLWECYVIEELDNIPGLPRGSFAFFAKAHCAALGETLSAQLFSALHELSPEGRASPPKVARYFDRSPTFVDVAARTATDALRTPWSVARLLARQAGPLIVSGAKDAVGVLGGHRRSGGSREALPQVSAPPTRFNGQVTPQRVTEGVRFDLHEVARIRARVEGGTVNDVAIAVIAGALHRYLGARFEAPASDLVAEAPIASRSATQVFGVRTFVDSAIMPLHADVEDPLERLRDIVAETSRRKARQSMRPPRRLALEAMELVPTLVIGIASDLAQRARLGSRVAPIVNTTISSIRGPDVPLYLAGAKLVGYYGFSVVHDLAGLAHVVGYCNGEMTIGVAACRSMLPDPARYAQFLRDAYAELRDASGTAGAGERRVQRSPRNAPVVAPAVPDSVAVVPGSRTKRRRAARRGNQPRHA